MPAPASVTKWALYGGSAAASRGSQPGNPSNQPCGDSTAQAPAATLGTPSATKPSRTQVGTFALVIEVLMPPLRRVAPVRNDEPATTRSEEHTSELQSLMRISYAVFCLKKQQQN